MNEETKLTNLTERHQNDYIRKDTSLPMAKKKIQKWVGGKFEKQDIQDMRPND